MNRLLIVLLLAGAAAAQVVIEAPERLADYRNKAALLDSLEIARGASVPFWMIPTDSIEVVVGGDTTTRYTYPDDTLSAKHWVFLATAAETTMVNTAMQVPLCWTPTDGRVLWSASAHRYAMSWGMLACATRIGIPYCLSAHRNQVADSLTAVLEGPKK